LLRGIELYAPQHILLINPDWYHYNLPNTDKPSIKVNIESFYLPDDPTTRPFDYKVTISRDPPYARFTSGELQWFSLHQFRTNANRIIYDTSVTRAIETWIPDAFEETGGALGKELVTAVAGLVLPGKTSAKLVSAVLLLYGTYKAFENEKGAREAVELVVEALEFGFLSDAAAFGTTLIVTSDGRYVICTYHFDVRELEHRLGVYYKDTGRNLDANNVMNKIQNGNIDQDILDFVGWYGHDGEYLADQHQRPWLLECCDEK